MSEQRQLHSVQDDEVAKHPASEPIVDCTSGDVYEIARLHNTEPLPTSNGLVAIEMPCPFRIRNTSGTEYGEAGDFLVEQRQKMERHVIIGWQFQFLFYARQ